MADLPVTRHDLLLLGGAVVLLILLFMLGYVIGYDDGARVVIVQ